MISADVLQRFSLLSELEPAFIERLSSISMERTIEQGEWLFHEGDNAEALYLILQGSIDLKLKFDENRDIYGTLTTLREGNALGWSAMVEPYVYSLGAIASYKTRLVRLDGEALRALLKDQPEQGYVLMQNIARAMASRVNLLSERAPSLSWRFISSVLLSVLGIGTALLVLLLGIATVFGLVGGYTGASQTIPVALFCLVFPVVFLLLAHVIYPPSSLITWLQRSWERNQTERNYSTRV